MANATPSRSDVYAALAKRSGFEVTEEHESAKQLNINGRSSLERWPFFLPIIHALLTASGKPGNPWTCDVSKKYVLKNRKVCYTWRLIFQGAALHEHYRSIASVINAAGQPARVELTSQLLPGYKPGDVRGGVNAKGKGTSSADTLPMVLTRPR